MPNPRAQQPLSFDQIIKDAKSLGVPAQALLDALAGGVKGSVSATVGAPADIYNLLNQVSFRGQLPTMPYGSEDISKMLPDVIPNQDKSRQHSAEYGENMGSFIPTPMAGQALKGAVKLGAKGAKALGEGLGQLTPSGSGPQTLASQVGAIKLKGGNWFANEVENKLKELKQSDLLNNIKYYHGPEFEKAREARIKELKEYGNEGALRVAKILEENIEPDKVKGALNQWVDKNLTNYVKKEMGTPEDPVRLMIDRRVEEINKKYKNDLARADRVAQRATEETDPRKKANFEREANRLKIEANFDLELSLKHTYHFPFESNSFNPNEINSIEKIRKKEGFPTEGMGKSDQAKAYETNVDLFIDPKKVGEIQALPARLAEANLAELERSKARINLDAKVSEHLKKSIPSISDQQINDYVIRMGINQKEIMVGDNAYSNANAKAHSLRSSDDDINLRRLKEDPDINKIAPEANIYSVQTYPLMFEHILDVLKEDLASGRLKPEDLKNISMEQAVRKTADYDLALAKKMQEAQAKKLEDMTVHKEYPEGMRWVQLDKPSQFASESQAMGHSVRGYEPPKNHPDWTPESGEEGSLNYGLGGWEAIKSGKAKVYSLVDSKGNPHTTVEVGKGNHPIGTSGRGNDFPHELTYGDYDNNYLEIPKEKQKEIYELGKKLHFENPDAYAENRLLSGNKTPEPFDSFQKAADMLLGERPGFIKQIKGKSNRAPNDQYLPFVQDFVKSGNWSDVGDLQYTGLRHSDEAFGEEALQALKDQGVEIPKYVTMDEAIKMSSDAMNNVGKNLPPVEGMKRGGAVNISNNPDTMYMELMDRKFAGGGAIKALTKALTKTEKALPDVLPRAKAITKEEIRPYAQKMSEMMEGKFVRPNPSVSQNPAGKSLDQWKREQELKHDIRPTALHKDLPIADIEKQLGMLKMGISGDTTVAEKVLHEAGPYQLDSPTPLHGGPLYGLGGEGAWASNNPIAKNVQQRVQELSRAHNDAPVLGQYMAMGKLGSDFAQHFADANLRAIDLTKMTPQQIEMFNELIRKGSPKSGPRPTFPGIEDKDLAYMHFQLDPELRKHFNALMQKPDYTKPLNLPDGRIVHHAVTEPELRDLPVTTTGFSQMGLNPNANPEGLVRSIHPTYSHVIPMEPNSQMTRTRYPVPAELEFRDVFDYAKNLKTEGNTNRYRPEDMTRVLQTSTPRQIVDPQHIDEIKMYEELMKEYTGKKKGGAIKKAKGGEISEDDIQMEVRPL
jgi:hypothetical protein